MQRAISWNPLTSIVSKLRRDVSGISLIYVTIALPALMGCVLLAIDVGRFWSLQSSLQHAADSIALAAAGELDRQPDALERADNARKNLVSNPTVFATSVTTIDGNSVEARYLKSLPANDASPITAADVTTDPIEAGYVEITVNPVTFTTVFPATFIGAATNTKEVSARAVAGFDMAVCDVTPIYVCNPYEASANTDEFDTVELIKHFDRANYPDRIGRLIQLQQTGGAGAQYIPGNYGFLQPNPPNNPTASELREWVGVDRPRACFRRSGVALRSGPIESVRFGFNVRFDLYEGPMSSRKSEVAYRPARDVRKGMANDKPGSTGAGTACEPEPALPGNASALLRDNCFMSSPSTCSHAGGRMGNGTWEKRTYWHDSHNILLPLPITPLPGAISGQHISRYDVYQYELNTPGDLEKDSNGNGPLFTGGEKGSPVCYSGGLDSLSDSPDRRIFQAAVLNCRALVANGKLGLGADNPVPVAAFARFFLTEPVRCIGALCNRDDPNDADDSVWAEMMGLSEVRDMVQLYR